MADQSSQSSTSVALYALRAEGQNFKWVLYDTHDLSAGAGGSRLLEEIPGEVEKVLISKITQAGESFEKVQSASSSAVYACCCSEGKMKIVLRELREAFHKDGFAHLTVAVEAVKVQDGGCEPGKLAESVEQSHLHQLFAAIRYAQMTSPNAAVPAVANGVKLACDKDHLRPRGAKSGFKWSDSVYTRREQGKDFRRELTVTQDGNNESVFTARTFEGLTSLSDPTDPRNLKLAVISIDGNGFGKLITDNCKNGARLQQFSGKMKGLQDAFEQSLLQDWYGRKGDKRYFVNAKVDDAFAMDGGGEGPNNRPDRLLRLQRLVTAGDDAIYLMPAWLAWEFLQKFFGVNWTITLTDPAASIPLTFRVGMVNCHHNAPIHRIRKLADELSNLARNAAKDAPVKIDNPIAYEVLKSFDLVGPDLAKYREDRVQKKLLPYQMLLDGKKLKDQTLPDGTIQEGKLKQLRELEEKWPAGMIKDLSVWKDQSDDAVNAFHLSQLGPYLPKE